jgi:hypothetical protein
VVDGESVVDHRDAARRSRRIPTVTPISPHTGTATAWNRPSCIGALDSLGCVKFHETDHFVYVARGASIFQTVPKRPLSIAIQRPHHPDRAPHPDAYGSIIVPPWSSVRSDRPGSRSR